MNNPPAFPRTGYSGTHEVIRHTDGMTLRDYFMAHIAQGILASGGVDLLLEGAGVELARLSQKGADAMLQAREQ